MQDRKRDTDVQNRLLESVGEGEGGMFWENSIETSILSRVKQITSPGWMRETSAQGWFTGKTQRDGMEREVEWGFRMGNTCKSMADSCQCMTNTTKYCKVISLQLIKINEKIKTGAPWKKTWDKIPSILKSSDITLLTKICIVKAMVFPVVMYDC